MSYKEHAEKEMAAMLSPEADEMDRLMATQILELLEVFSSHGHSGFSAPYAIKMFSKLAAYEPIGPLMGTDNEWMDVSEFNDPVDAHVLYQNTRASHVFKEVYKDGRPDYAYDIDGKVFVDPDGCGYTNKDSRVLVEFPYTPKTERINVDAEGNVL